MTKKRVARNVPTGHESRKAVRTGRALDLRIAGWTYREIAARLGSSVKTVYFDVQEKLGVLDHENSERAERLRDLEAARLDHLQRMNEKGVRKGSASAIRTAVSILDRRAKLFGLDAPTKISGPTGGAVPLIVHQQLKE